jgi:hypothetical protein
MQDLKSLVMTWATVVLTTKGRRWQGFRAASTFQEGRGRVGNCLCRHGRCLATLKEEAKPVDGISIVVMDDFGTERPSGLVTLWRI